MKTRMRINTIATIWSSSLHYHRVMEEDKVCLFWEGVTNLHVNTWRIVSAWAHSSFPGFCLWSEISRIRTFLTQKYTSYQFEKVRVGSSVVPASGVPCSFWYHSKTPWSEVPCRPMAYLFIVVESISSLMYFIRHSCSRRDSNCAESVCKTKILFF